MKIARMNTYKVNRLGSSSVLPILGLVASLSAAASAANHRTERPSRNAPARAGPGDDHLGHGRVPQVRLRQAGVLSDNFWLTMYVSIKELLHTRLAWRCGLGKITLGTKQRALGRQQTLPKSSPDQLPDLTLNTGGTDGVLRMMMLKNVFITVCMVLCAGVIGAGGGMMLAQESTARNRAGPSSASNQPAAQDSDLASLKDQVSPRGPESVAAASRRYDTLRKACHPGPREFAQPNEPDDTLVMLLIASDRLLEAEAASTKNRAEYVAAFVKHLARLKEIESFVKTAPAVVREKGVDLATEVRPGSKPEPQDKGWRETDLALATRYREDAEKLLDAAKQSEEKAHALYRLQPVRRSYDRLRKAYRPGTNYIDVLLNASDQLRGAEATAAKTRASTSLLSISTSPGSRRLKCLWRRHLKWVERGQPT